MKNTLKDLWLSYLLENLKPSEEERYSLNEVIKAEEKLRSTLNENQLEHLEEFSSKNNLLSGVCEFNAFKTGVSFACNFLIEALFCE